MKRDKWFRRVLRLVFWRLDFGWKARKARPEIPLVFLLGSARSGTTWLSNSISKSGNVRNFYVEPLHRITPYLWLSIEPDRAAARYQARIGRNHPLRMIYNVLADKEPSRQLFEEGYEYVVHPTADKVLIKEVHSLLQTEALVKSFDATFLLINRNPLAIVDSLLVSQTTNTRYFVHEYQYMKSARFLSAYCSEIKEDVLFTFRFIDQIPSFDLRVIAEKLFALYLLRLSFQVIARRYPDKVLLKNYEEIIKDPGKQVVELADFADLSLSEEAYVFEKDNHDIHHYSTARDTLAQIDKPLKQLHQHLPDLLEIFSGDRMTILDEFVGPYTHQIVHQDDSKSGNK